MCNEQLSSIYILLYIERVQRLQNDSMCVPILSSFFFFLFFLTSNCCPDLFPYYKKNPLIFKKVVDIYNELIVYTYDLCWN